MSLTRTLLVAAAAATLLSGGLLPADAGPAERETEPRVLEWTRTTDPVVLRPSTIARDVGCSPTGAACVIVGQRTDTAGSRVAAVQRWDGTAWTAETVPTDTALVDVSCSSVTDCVALEEPQEGTGVVRRLAVRSATGWRSVGFDVPTETVQLMSVSCASATWCLLTGADREMAVFDGAGVHWLARTVLTINAVSCTSPTYCAAAAGGGFLEWDGTRWTATALDDTGQVVDVDCWADQRCMATAVGQGGTASPTTFVRTPQSAWIPSGRLRGRPAYGDAGPLGADCDSGGTCHVLHLTGPLRRADLMISTWTAGTWSMKELPRPDGTLSALACRPGECVVAVVHSNDYLGWTHSSALHGTGTQWAQHELADAPVRLPETAPLEATCTAADWCLAIGRSGGADPYVVRGDGDDWRELPAALADQRDLDCWRPGGCVVVGSDGRRPRSAILREGRWRVLPALSPSWLVGGAITGVSCVGERCTYSGQYQTRKRVGTGIFVARRVAGRWRVQRLGPLFDSEEAFTGRPSMDCTTPSRCVVVTSMFLRGTSEPTSFVATSAGGRWRWDTVGTGLSLYEVDCADTVHCVAGGQSGDRGRILALGVDGTWRSVRVRGRSTGFHSVSCPTSRTCHAAAEGGRLQLLTRTPGGWRARPVGPRGMTDVACSGPRACLAFNGARTWLGR
ncbi:hypothetical protein EXE59_11555 [Nocardioides eburneiflavus]|uniref:Exo-alpha-sialidase n=1 Tax=Nocardioides eburneiflavus TaxID=2518372 RepID=A0A4Z1CGN1_9ACTN|nr:hypothetical protein [Nocardioides eburneiflavus]TGN64527.1 hypothetical protein EXE59_11555 [Nocardioides eburneiflavus]